MTRPRWTIALREWLARAVGALGAHRRDDELREELRAHLELAAEDEERRAGVRSRPSSAASVSDASPAPSHHAGVRCGGTAQAMDALRDQRGLPWASDIAHDLRDTWRGLRRSPTFTAVVLLTLMVGIGANTAIFTVVNSVLLKPLAYPKADELVAVWHSAPGAAGLTSVSGDLRLSSSMYFTYAENNHTFQNFGIWYSRTMAVTGVAEPEEVRGVGLSDGTLQALAVPPLLGRWLSAVDHVPNGPRRVMLGYGYWQRRFGGDPSVVGRGINIQSNACEIVGIMPEGFRVVTAEPDVIVPMALNRRTQTLPGFGFEAVARLKDGATIEQASADIARMVPIWMTSWPAAQGVSPRVYESWRIAPALRPLKADVVGNAANTLWVMTGTLAIVLLIACANVASLLLVRTEGRQQELAVRAALGAGWGRIVRGLLVESVFLGLLGGALGLLVARAGLQYLVALGPATLPRLHEIAIDRRAIAFALAVSVLSALAFGLIAAIKYAGPQLSSVLRGTRTSTSNRERSRARDVLVVVQVAMALVLLVSSGLMIRTFQALRSVEPGFSGAQQLQTVQVSIPTSLVGEPERVARMQQAMADALAAIPGVESAAFATQMPMVIGTANWDAIRAEDRTYAADEVPTLRVFKGVSPGLFHTAGTRLIAGRDFTWADLYDQHRYLIVSDNLARELWGTPAAALGKRLQTLPLAPWREVIGVAQDVYENGVHEAAPAIVYWPTYGESAYRVGRIDVERVVTFIVRSHDAGSERLAEQIRRAIWSLNANLSLGSEQTMLEIYDRSLARTSFTLVLLAIAAGMALLLGVIGIYGVISYAVSQRMREIGIRLALGAPRGELERLFVHDGLTLTATGVAIGLVVAMALSRAMSTLLFGVSAIDPITYVAVPLLLAVATVLASYIPARRAATVDPVHALKAD